MNRRSFLMISMVNFNCLVICLSNHVVVTQDKILFQYGIILNVDVFDFVFKVTCIKNDSKMFFINDVFGADEYFSSS